MVVIIRSGFQEVKLEIFRKKSISKGQELLDSCHVSEVREEIYNEGYRRLLGTVLRETPGAESKKKNENCHQVTIELNADRTVSDTVCSCKGGKGSCKHAAAVCIFANVENTCSKTDLPMIWNKPSDSQLEKYAKGRRIEEMFEKQRKVVTTSRVCRIQDVENIPENFLALNYSMAKMLTAEKKVACEREDREKIRLEKEDQIRGVVEQLFEHQLLNNNRESYHAYEIITALDLTIKLKSMRCPLQYSDVYSEIEVDKSKWMKICLNSIGQSESAVWHAERYLRITCSSRVHRIKTRKIDFEGLAKRSTKELE